MHVLQDSFHIDLSAGLMLVYIYIIDFFFHISVKYRSVLLRKRRSYISSVDQNDVNVIPGT
jgi:hypothetical protein